MYIRPKNCPNSNCMNHNNPVSDWFKKNGSYKSKRTSLTRYQCKACKKSFSNSSEKSTYKQHKPEINIELFKLLVSGVSLRRCSTILDVSYATVMSKFEYLAEQAKVAHQKHIKTIQTSCVQVDELETFIQSKAKPLSVAMAVRVKTGEILGFKIAKMPAKGLLAEIGVKKYNWTVDERAIKFQSLILDITQTLRTDIVFKSDSHPSYEKWIKNQVAYAKFEKVVSGKKPTSRGKDKEFDPLFTINNTFARMRHDMNRLGRKTWSTTKSISGLEQHIWLYISWNNKYEIK